jgi:hypothetical protein
VKGVGRRATPRRLKNIGLKIIQGRIWFGSALILSIVYWLIEDK